MIIQTIKSWAIRVLIELLIVTTVISFVAYLTIGQLFSIDFVMFPIYLGAIWFGIRVIHLYKSIMWIIINKDIEED